MIFVCRWCPSIRGSVQRRFHSAEEFRGTPNVLSRLFYKVRALSSARSSRSQGRDSISADDEESKIYFTKQKVRVYEIVSMGPIRKLDVDCVRLLALTILNDFCFRRAWKMGTTRLRLKTNHLTIYIFKPRRYWQLQSYTCIIPNAIVYPLEKTSQRTLTLFYEFEYDENSRTNSHELL